MHQPTLVMIDTTKNAVARYVGRTQTHQNEFSEVPPANIVELYRQNPVKLLAILNGEE